MPEDSPLHHDIVGIIEAVPPRAEQGGIIQIEPHTVQLVICLLDGTYYAFYGTDIKEIVPVPEIAYVPGMPAWLLGVIQIRGEIESVLDVRQVLTLPPDSITKQSRIAIGQVGELRSGLLVDSVEDVLEVPAETIHEPVSALDPVAAAFVAGELLYQEQPVLLLDLAIMFDRLLR